MNTKLSLYVRIATLGPVGYMLMSGTMATIATMPVMYYLNKSMPSGVYALVVIACAIISLSIINKALEYFKEDADPRQIVLDEFIGCLVAFYAVPLCWQTMVAGFLLFRLFDITKWFGIRASERLVGAFGVLIDDILAALLTNVIVRVAYYYIVGSV